MDPIINTPGGYALDDSGNFKKWTTPKQKLRQRLLNRVLMRRGAFVIQGYEEAGSQLYTLNRVPRSQRSERARQFVDEALKPEVEMGEITRVVDVILTETEKGRYNLSIFVELPDGDILDLEVSRSYDGSA